MLPSFAVSPLPACSPQAGLDASSEAQLLGEVGPCPDARVLVLGRRRTDVVGALIRRGCLAATSLQQDGKPQAGAFDVVVVAHVAPGDDLDRLVHCCWRALAPRGGLVACLIDGAHGGSPGLELERRLRLHGFDTSRTQVPGGSCFLRGTLKVSGVVAHHG